MSIGVTGEANHFVVTQNLAGFEPMVHFDSLIAESGPPHPLQDARPPAPTLVGMLSFEMGSIGERRMHLASTDFLKPGSIEGVIEMAVSEVEVANVGEGMALNREGLTNSFHSTEKTGVDQVDAIMSQDEVVGDAGSLEWNDLHDENKVS